MTHDLHHLFHPRSIAMIGISTNPAKFGGGFWTKAIQEMGYRGEIYPISPKLSEFNGLQVYPSMRDIPSKVDLAIVTIPAQNIPQIIEDCVAKGVKFIQLYSAGFSETDEDEGIKLEREILTIARSGGVRIVGPNCMGVYCPTSGLSWRTDFSKESGPLGIMAQSGWNAVELIKRGAIRGLLCSELISYGNASDLNESDFLDYFAFEPKTQVVAAYIEGVRDGQRFFSTLQKASKLKPVVILKGGYSDAGTRAAASHTSSLAGKKEIWNSVLKQTGAIEVFSFDELMDTVIACLYMKVPENRNIAIIGSGGGPSVTAADECENNGLRVPLFPHKIRQRLNELMPKQGTSMKNPVDTPFWWEQEKFSQAIQVVADCSDIGSLIVHAEIDSTFLLAGRVLISEMIQSMIDSTANCGKPAVIVLRSVGTPEVLQVLQEEQNKFMKAGVPVYPSIARASRAILNLIQYNRRLRNQN